MQFLQLINISPKLLVVFCAFSLVSGSPLQEVKNVNESSSIRTTNSPPAERSTEIVIADERADGLTTRIPGEERGDLTTRIPGEERGDLTTRIPGEERGDLTTRIPGEERGDLTTGIPGEQRSDDLTTRIPGEERSGDLTTRIPGEERSGDLTTRIPGLERSDDEQTTSVPTSEDLPEVELLRSGLTTNLPDGRNNVDATEIPAVTSRDQESVQWVVSDSATEPVANNEISGDDSMSGKLSGVSGARRFIRSFDDGNWTYPTTPHPDNDTETSTVFPQLSDIEIPIERISNKILVGRKDCLCGTYKKKIVGGNDTGINEYPWTVALVRKGKDDKGAYCGGTLINDRYIATASHCVDGASPSKIEVWLNHQSFQDENLTTTIRRDVEAIIMHPNYDSKNIDNDIALLRMSDNVTIGEGEGEYDGSESIIPACIPVDNSNSYEEYQATVCGWGATSQGGPVSTELKCVEVPVLSNTDCNWRSLYLGKITDNMLCAGELTSGGKDSCQGDSGGPLVVQTENQKTLIGIVSFGYGCARPLAPGVYTRVGRFSSWIYSNTQDAEYCGSTPT